MRLASSCAQQQRVAHVMCPVLNAPTGANGLVEPGCRLSEVAEVLRGLV